jgi:hypothetical protein
MHVRRSLLASLFALASLHAGVAAAQGLEVRKIVPTEATVKEEVEIYGKGFGEGTRVFLGDLALSVQVVSPYRIRVIIPEGARSGALVVKRRGRVASSKELTIVRFHAPPVITSVSPGVAKPGTLIRINGSGFGEANRTIYVSVGGAIAEVVERKRDTLIVRVPAEAHSGSVIVVVARGGQAIASTPIRIDVASREPSVAKPSASR